MTHHKLFSILCPKSYVLKPSWSPFLSRLIAKWWWHFRIPCFIIQQWFRHFIFCLNWTYNIVLSFLTLLKLEYSICSRNLLLHWCILLTFWLLEFILWIRLLCRYYWWHPYCQRVLCPSWCPFFHSYSKIKRFHSWVGMVTYPSFKSYTNPMVNANWHTNRIIWL